jgi:ATP-dependent RNA helicase DDX10/DBP4
LGAARTGSGKTLAYLVPVLEKLYRERWSKADGVGALIIVPTRELAMQIFDVLRTSVGKTHMYSAGLIIGGKDLSEEQERISGMNILICTPGRILQHFEQTYGFNVNNLQILVLDEADRILDMGFQQNMNDILSYLPAGRQTLLFSATQTRNLKELAKLSLKSPEYIAVHESSSTALPNKLIQHYTFISADQKINLLYSYIKTHLQAKSIVFLSSGKQVRFLYEIFRRIRPGVPLMHIHGVSHTYI